MITLEQHLAAHPLYLDEDAEDCNVCGCGWRIDGEALDYSDRCDTAKQVAELHAAHVAATWREARTVRTVEDLDALPLNTVVQEVGVEHTWIRHGDLWHCSCDGTDVPWSSEDLWEEQQREPLLVVWTPEDGAA